jgi:hypothetical protein
VGLFYLAMYWIVKNLLGFSDWPPLHERPAMYYSLGAFIIGGQFISVGFLAEMFTAYYGRDVPAYSVAETTRREMRSDGEKV